VPFCFFFFLRIAYFFFSSATRLAPTHETFNPCLLLHATPPFFFFPTAVFLPVGVTPTVWYPEWFTPNASHCQRTQPGPTPFHPSDRMLVPGLYPPPNVPPIPCYYVPTTVPFPLSLFLICALPLRWTRHLHFSFFVPVIATGSFISFLSFYYTSPFFRPGLLQDDQPRLTPIS